MTTTTNEAAFETHIGQELVSLHCHHRGKPADLDKTTGINTAELLAFLEATQQKELEKLVKDYRKHVPKMLTNRLADTARSTRTRTTFAPTTSASRSSTRAKKPQEANKIMGKLAEVRAVTPRSS